MKITIDIKELILRTDPKFKVKSMIEAIAGTVRAHFPHHKFDITYDDINVGMNLTVHFGIKPKFLEGK